MSIRGRVGIGSYAFRYAIGFPGFTPRQSMNVTGFFEAARRMGFHGVQLCENLPYAADGLEAARDIRAAAARTGVFLELGTREVHEENLSRHIDLARATGAGLIRLVLGTPSAFPEKDVDGLTERAVRVLRGVVPRLRDAGIRLGVENHFDLRTTDLLRIVEEVDSDWVGTVFDSTNAIGFIERPEETLAMLMPHLFSVHLKDYVMEKVEAGYLMRGCVLGEGCMPIETVLCRTLAERPEASIIMEMTIRRDPAMETKGVVCWEEQQVLQSAMFLRRMMDRILPHDVE